MSFAWKTNLKSGLNSRIMLRCHSLSLVLWIQEQNQRFVIKKCMLDFISIFAFVYLFYKTLMIFDRKIWSFKYYKNCLNLDVLRPFLISIFKLFNLKDLSVEIVSFKTLKLFFLMGKNQFAFVKLSKVSSGKMIIFFL